MAAKRRTSPHNATTGARHENTGSDNTSNTQPPAAVAPQAAGPGTGQPAPQPAPQAAPAQPAATPSPAQPAAAAPQTGATAGSNGTTTPTPAAAASNGGRPQTGIIGLITARRGQYMISPRQTRGLETFSADFVAQQLTASPDIEVIKTVHPPRLFGLQSDDGPALGPLVLARMAPDKAKLLQSQAGARLAIERDPPLAYMLDPSPTEMAMPNPGVLVPQSTGFSVSFEVLGQNGPLPEAEIYVFGSVWPSQGVTDAAGRATMNIQGESPDTIRSIYVKPRVDYWGFWLDRPQLTPGSVVRIGVKALGDYLSEFPGRQLLGWGERAMGLDRVPASYDGRGIKVAVIDSGLAPTHRNLRGVSRGASMVGTDRNAWTVDTIGHGSHCAGIIGGGPAGAGGGVRGFAPGAEIHVCRIFPGGRFSDLVSALDYCMEQGIDVANMSLGGGEPSQIIEERIVRAKQMGMACIIAAGNSSGPVQFPASTPHCLAVAAMGKWGEFPEDSFHARQALDGFTSRDGYFPAKFSCFGPEIDVCAPGVAIVSSLPADGFGAWDGTSMATPHVTGLAALVYAHHPDFKGAFQNRDARRVERLFEILKSSAIPLQFGDTNRSGAGMPYAPRALGLEQQDVASAGIFGAPLPGSGTPPLDALRRLLGMLSTQQPGAPGASAMAPQSVGPLQADVSVAVPRGPAQTNGAAVHPAFMDPNPAQIREILRRAGLRV